MGFLDVGPGWALLIALLFYVNPLGCFLPFCAAAVFHEIGHVLALALLDVPLRRLRLRPGGAVLETGPMSCREELICPLPGPAANLLLLPLGRLWPKLAAFSLLLALFNLLPFPALDGGRALHAALVFRSGVETADRVMLFVSLFLGTGIAALSLWAGIVLHGGFWPVLTAALVLLRVGLDLFPRKER